MIWGKESPKGYIRYYILEESYARNCSRIGRTGMILVSKWRLCPVASKICVSMKAESGDTESVTVRLFGTNTDYVINREPELQAIKYLSAAGFGAKLLSVFANGMVQSFINARTLTPTVTDPLTFRYMRIPNLSAQIAKELHRFHQVEIPASLLEFADGEKQRKYQTISFTEIHDELVELKKQELTGRLNSPVVYAHNDLLCGNVMVNDEEGTDHWQGQIDTSENDGAVTCPTCLRELSMVEATKTDHEQQ
ncbi:hypothetical protein SAY86_010167 [Trapa natans]|uniref:ethanolamine kinase n=1 Tax=Trapa natans TaxID=22666 RepID=A0AAN7QQV8_TRANT|nr:hypothetical protein SAY86_010167 [Trapa natans]